MPANIAAPSAQSPGTRQRVPPVSPLSDTVPTPFPRRRARTNQHASYLRAARRLTIAPFMVEERSGITATQTPLLPPATPPIPTTPTAPAPSWSWVGSSADGSLVLPTTTNVFYALHNHHNHPHQQYTTSPAICVLGSGGTSGGLHSAALALGWLRALHRLGVLHRAQLLAAGPGLCSWLAAAVCYATQQQEQEQQQHNCVEDTVGRLLGPMVPPEQCGLMGMGVGMQGGPGSMVEDKRQSLEAALVDPAPFRDSVLGELMKTGGWPAQQAARWSRSMMLAFLEPHGAVGGWAERDHGMATLEATQDCSVDEAEGEGALLLLPPQPRLPLADPLERSAHLCGGGPAGCFDCCGGTGGETTSIHAALEAGAETVIALVPSSVPLGMDNNAYAHANKELAGLFGRWVDDPTDPRFTPHRAAAYNARTQVFPSPAFDDLLASLRARHSAGGPAVHVASYTLEPPTFPHCCAGPSLGHPSPRRVRVVWVVNAAHGAWEGRLPWHVRFELHTDRRLAEAGMMGASAASLDDQQQGQGQQQQQGQYDSLHDFPCCAALASTRGTAAAASSSSSPTPSPQLVSLLAHHAAGMVEGAREQLREAVGLGVL